MKHKTYKAEPKTSTKRRAKRRKYYTPGMSNQPFRPLGTSMRDLRHST